MRQTRSVLATLCSICKHRTCGRHSSLSLFQPLSTSDCFCAYIQAAVDQMRKVLNNVAMDGIVVIGEGTRLSRNTKRGVDVRKSELSTRFLGRTLVLPAVDQLN